MGKNNVSIFTKNCLSLFLMVTGAFILVMAAVLLQKPQPVSAVSGDLNKVINVYPAIEGTNLDSCSLCHTSNIPGLNLYGRAYRTAGRTEAGVRAIENQDSDLDGFTNLAEFNALTFPGDANSKPAGATNTAAPPTATRTPTNTRTATSAPATRTPTVTRTATTAPSTNTATSVPATATAVSTNTPEPTVAEATATIVPSTSTSAPGVTETATETEEATAEVTATAGTTETAETTATAILTPQVTTTAVPGTLTLTPEADASVRRNHRGSNYGSSKTLRVDNSPQARTFLRFATGDINLEQIASAQLRVYITEDSNRGFKVHVVKDDTWKEGEINYRNAPRGGDTVGQVRDNDKGQWVTVDLTTYVKQQGKDQLSLVLYGDSNNGLSIASRETGETAPQLIITFNP